MNAYARRGLSALVRSCLAFLDMLLTAISLDTGRVLATLVRNNRPSLNHSEPRLSSRRGQRRYSLYFSLYIFSAKDKILLAGAPNSCRNVHGIIVEHSGQYFKAVPQKIPGLYGSSSAMQCATAGTGLLATASCLVLLGSSSITESHLIFFIFTPLTLILATPFLLHLHFIPLHLIFIVSGGVSPKWVAFQVDFVPEKPFVVGSWSPVALLPRSQPKL
ncbi:hypothetical protein WJX74_009943 [Apatococcus lobatus]|uniref:Uncharacterized protein n=1 Tax=Apatococcus lobatus TaxID=904363 RepID=A0AAW1R3W3_9CHLO